jgi:hypothetical protein
MTRNRCQPTTITETYSIDVPGSSRDGKLHLVERGTTVQTNDSGRTTTEQQIKQPDPGDAQAGLGISTKTTNVIVPNAQGSEEPHTISVRNTDETNFGVVCVETKKIDRIPAIQVQIAPSDKRK